mmetsp:Transcript_43918/g.99245  ORF Transcript_43918/g.99245 Transcript_43918/m.99245 type:complete len:201 (+) Transcript_43918:543-1145(+)
MCPRPTTGLGSGASPRKRANGRASKITAVEGEDVLPWTSSWHVSPWREAWSICRESATRFGSSRAPVYGRLLRALGSSSPASTSPPNAAQALRPPSRTWTFSWPKHLKVHQTLGAEKEPAVVYNTTVSSLSIPSSLQASANCASEGSMCGRSLDVSATRSMSKNRALDMRLSRNSARASRRVPPGEGRCQEASTNLTLSR